MKFNQAMGPLQVMEFARTKIECLGLILAKEKIELQEHALKSLSKFIN